MGDERRRTDDLTGERSLSASADERRRRTATQRVAVVAIGGNSLIVDAMHQSIPDQFEAVVEAARCITELIADGWSVAITHGNGPQVGFALRRSELSMFEVPPMPMDYADADTQGVIGYMLQRALGNECRRRAISCDPLTVVTQVVVGSDDPAMLAPSKPVGSFMNAEQAHDVAERDGWSIAEEPGRGWRRVVPSPEPRRIVELDAIRSLIASGYVVVCCGGGGIPVVEADGALSGVRAVIDKDLTASMLAREIAADLLVICTAAPGIAIDFGGPQERWLERVDLQTLREHLKAGEFEPGSMAPKVEAVVRYLDAVDGRAIVTDSRHLLETVRTAQSGTTITRG